MSTSRRQAILETLTHSKEPITGSDLAEAFEVSRQVIVQDIAILRAKGHNILATSNGYVVSKPYESDKLIKTFISTHKGFYRMVEELNIIVEYGGKILNVIVEHPVYGEITGTLMLESTADIDKFMQKVSETNARPLASLTEGDHIHTIEVPSEKVYQLMMKELEEKGFVQVLD